MGNAAKRPSVWRRARVPDLGLRRARRTRLAALAGVCGVLLLPAPTSAQADASPTITPTIRGTLGANGWYQSNVTVNWTYSSPPNSSTGCDARTITADTTGTSLLCIASWDQPPPAPPIEVRYPLTIRVDRLPPAVSGAASRVADSSGWYNHAVGVSFSGTDATSGVASCSAATYSGPDSASAQVAGTCTDAAGNVGSGTLALAYDATPPQLLKLSSKPTKRGVVLTWAASADTQSVEVARSPGKGSQSVQVVYAGTAKTFPDKGLRVGRKYRYTVSAIDAAANKASRTVKITATGALLSPAPGERVTDRPRLTWTPTRGASYYNVQLVRGGTILSVWPRSTHLTLPRSWVFHGHHHRLSRGVYRWYVWPGFGQLKAARYGGLVGRSSFLYAR
jgi:hypothetical protein